MNKILIICEENDPSALEVIEWLKYFNQDIVVLTENTCITNLNIFIENEFIEIEFKIFSNVSKQITEFKLTDLKSYFYRRGSLIFDKIKCQVCEIDIKAGLQYFINKCLNKNDSLCHGDSGNILILKKLNGLKFLDDSKYTEILNNFCYSISHRKFNPGYEYSFLPVELFTGKSGLIYSLLNLYTNNSESILEFR